MLLLELVSTTRRHGAPPKTPGAWSRWWVRGTTGRRPTAPPPSGAAAGLRRLRGGGEAAPRLRRAAQQHGRARSRRAGRVVGRRACPLASTLDCSGTPPAPSWCDERQVASSTPAPRIVGGMGVRPGFLRWGLLVALLLGVVLMHHIPYQHDRPHAEPPSAVTAELPLPSATSDDGCDCHHASEHSGAPTPSPHDLLHLCLAILIGFAAFFLARVRCRRGTATPGPGSLLAVPGARTRPPVPVARRLAALCVLRC